MFGGVGENRHVRLLRKYPGKPLVGAIRESPVSAPRAFSFQVVRVATLMKYSEGNGIEESKLAAGSAVTDLGFLPALGMTERRGPDRSCKSVLPTPSVISTPSAVNPQNLAPRTPSPSNTPPPQLDNNNRKCHKMPHHATNSPLFPPPPSYVPSPVLGESLPRTPIRGLG